jgi:hypothetical protein
VPELEPIRGVRVVATPAAIDAATWSRQDVTLVWRFARDEAFGGAPGDPVDAVQVDDPDAIIETEFGFSAAYLMPDDLAKLRDHSEFGWPAERPALVQGKIAGVPARVWLADSVNGDCLLVATAYADELADRLGWSHR